MLRYGKIVLVTGLGLGLASNCGKKSKGSGGGPGGGDVDLPFDTTEASETLEFSKAVATNQLAITSIDVIGAAAKAKAKLRLAGTDYDEDASNVRLNVFDPALDAIQQAGDILCFFNQANYIEMAGKGPYVAQTDMKLCFKDKGGDPSQNKSSGTSKEIVNVVVDSSRASDRSPLIVKAWFEMAEGGGGGGQPMKIQMQVKMVVAEGQSEANPVGIFRLSWEGKMGGQVGAKGHIETSRSKESGKINLVMIDANQGEGQTFLTQAAAQLDWDAEAQEVTGGRVRTSAPGEWDQNGPGPNQQYAAAFNDTAYLRRNVTESKTQCLSKSEFDYSIYRYGLYDTATGVRKDLNSGFGFEITANGKTEHGYAGYWGVWLPEYISLTDGMNLTRKEYGQADVTYTVKTGPGKLLKYEKAEITLDELDGVEISGGDGVIAYNKNLGRFQKIGQYGEKGLEYLPAPTDFSLQQPWSQGQAGNFNAWAQSLGGSLIIPFNAAGVPQSPAFYFKQTNVTASQGDLTLYCLVNCMKTDVDQQNANGSSWPQSSSDPSPFYWFDYNSYFSAAQSGPAAAAAHLNDPTVKKTYAWTSSTMTLTQNGARVGLANGVQNGEQNSWGYQVGPLVSSLSGVSNPWDLNAASVYYMWETGSESQNKFTRLVDANNTAVIFDAPLFLDYTHSKAKDRSGLDSGAGAKYYGKKINFQYGGFGELWGIPSEPDETGNWKPLFALQDGVTLGANNEFKVRGIDGEMRMRPVAESTCSGLSVASLPELPTEASYKAPNLGDAPAGVAAQAPKVVEGIVVAE